MRVLCVSDLQFREFPGLPDGKYAILSHVWGTAEISYKDMKDYGPSTLPFHSEDKETAARKLEGCRAKAREGGIEYFWIDTCCIDKPNHSEFNEAINSMFHWYKKAEICFVYLADVERMEDLPASKWFTRGWTLQELLAPSHVWFFNNRWECMGSKQNELTSIISEVSKIPRSFLCGADLEEASLAMRMSWAAHRSTSKEEDLAYCLLGIFDVHMPLLYGERLIGAFRRLQLKILEMQDDTSIFAWRTPDFAMRPDPSVMDTYGLLAPFPSSFTGCHDHIRAELPVVTGYKQGIRTPVTFNNKGLHLSLPVMRNRDGKTLMALGCTRSGLENTRYAIRLKDISVNGGRYVRIDNIHRLAIDADFMRNAKFEEITTEHRLFKKLPVVPERTWIDLQSTLAGAMLLPKPDKQHSRMWLG